MSYASRVQDYKDQVSSFLHHLSYRYPERKIEQIKQFRAKYGVGLREAKDIVESFNGQGDCDYTELVSNLAKENVPKNDPYEGASLGSILGHALDKQNKVNFPTERYEVVCEKVDSKPYVANDIDEARRVRDYLISTFGYKCHIDKVTVVKVS